MPHLNITQGFPLGMLDLRISPSHIGSPDLPFRNLTQGHGIHTVETIHGVNYASLPTDSHRACNSHRGLHPRCECVGKAM